MYNAYITRIKNLRSHSNADRLQVGECFGNSTIVNLDYKENDLGIYFPTDGKVGMEFATKNNMLRKKDENGNQIGGFLDPDKRNITTLKLRGETSDGVFLPLSSLETFTDISKLKEGDTVSVLNGIVICEKYIPSNKTNRVRSEKCGDKDVKKVATDTICYPLFEEHADTLQLMYNLNNFKVGDICYLTLKCHGTSARTSNTIMNFTKKQSKLQRFLKIKNKTAKYWNYVSGTRRTVLKNYDKGYYGSDEFRKVWNDFFVGKLAKGEEIFYEIVGYIGDKPIMPQCSNSKTKDKEFIKQYGATTTFSYGCNVGNNKILVYRMTFTNEDGFVYELPTEQVKYRCEQMNVEFVPIFEKFIYTTREDLLERVNKYVDGADPIGKTHVREGVVVRIDNKSKFVAYKHKNVSFKILEGIIKTDAVVADMEESQETVDIL